MTADGRYLVVDPVNVWGAVTEATRHNSEAMACVELRGAEASACQAEP